MTAPTTNTIILDSDHRSSLFKTLKKRRGWSKEYLAQVNNSDHNTLKDMNLMLANLKRIHDNQEAITVLPDFDMDGICSGITMWAGLAELGFNVELYIPDYNFGHDIGIQTIDDLMSKHPQTQAIVTCDGGVNSHKGMNRGKEYGLTMLVTDHHTQESNFSMADVIINPMRLDESYELGGICGAHVTWQVLDNYAHTFNPEKIRDIALLRAFVGIGTVSDVMPLLYENRAAVKDSISILRGLYVPLPAEDSATDYLIEESVLMQLIRSGDHSDEYLSAFEGLAVALRAFREYGQLEIIVDENGEPRLDENGDIISRRKNGKLRHTRDINEEFFGYYLAPAFNSIRRIEGDMQDAFGIFTENDVDKKYLRAQALLDANEARKAAVEKHITEIENIDQPWAPWVYITDAPSGMKGLIAAKFMHNTGMPVAVIGTCDDPNQIRSGSARAPEWFDIITEMNTNEYHAVGHAQACGVLMNNEKAVSAFAAHMELRAEEILAELQNAGIELFKADLKLGDGNNVDGHLDDIEEITDLAFLISTLKPFGKDFPAPTFELVLDMTECKVQPLGSDGSHLKITTASGIKILGWNMVDLMDDILAKRQATNPDDRFLRLIAKLSLNEFRDTTSPQFTIDMVLND